MVAFLDHWISRRWYFRVYWTNIFHKSHHETHNQARIAASVSVRARPRFFFPPIMKHKTKTNTFNFFFIQTNRYTGYAITFVFRIRSSRRGALTDDSRQPQSNNSVSPTATSMETSPIGQIHRSPHLLRSESLFFSQLRDALCTVLESTFISALLPFILIQVRTNFRHVLRVQKSRVISVVTTRGPDPTFAYVSLFPSRTNICSSKSASV